MIVPTEFEVCVLAHRTAWIRLAARFMPIQDAEDLVSQAILKAWRALPLFRGKSELSTWIGSIARNLIRDRKRTPEGRAEHVPMWDENNGMAPKFSEESTTRTVLFGEMVRLIHSTRMSSRERSGIRNLYERTERDVSRIRQARIHGLAKVRAAMECQR